MRVSYELCKPSLFKRFAHLLGFKTAKRLQLESVEINDTLALEAAAAMTLLFIFDFVLISIYYCRLRGLFLSFIYIPLDFPQNYRFWATYSQSVMHHTGLHFGQDTG